MQHGTGPGRPQAGLPRQVSYMDAHSRRGAPAEELTGAGAPPPRRQTLQCPNPEQGHWVAGQCPKQSTQSSKAVLEEKPYRVSARTLPRSHGFNWFYDLRHRYNTVHHSLHGGYEMCSTAQADDIHAARDL